MSRIPEESDARQSSNQLAGFLASDREATARFVEALAEFDRHRHWVELGYNCLFNYVHRELRMSRSAAFFRTKAAELVQRFPEVAAPLRDGRLCITAVVQLAKVMEEHNRAEILPRFFHQTNRAAKEIVAELAPILDPPRRELVTTLATITHPRTLKFLEPSVAPSSRSSLAPEAERGIANCLESSNSPREPMDVPSLGTPSAPWSAAAGHDPLVEPPSASSSPSNAPGLGIVAANDLSSQGENVSRPPNDCAFVSGSTEGEVHVPSEAVKGGLLHSSATVPVQPAPLREVLDGWTQPLTGDLHRLHVTVTKEFLRKLVAARDALAHFRARGAARASLAPTGRYTEVLEAGIDLILQRDARNKAITSRPLKEPRPCAADEMPARVRREVGERDHWECQYPLDSGGICGSKRNVQIDHIQPRSRGGPSVPENLRVLCAHHNALAARLSLGDEVMDPFTRRGRRGNRDP